MKPARTFKVGRTQNLAVVPLTAGFVFTFFFTEGLRVFSKMSAKNNGRGPQITDQVCTQVAQQYRPENRKAQQRPENIIFKNLLADFCWKKPILIHCGWSADDSLYAVCQRKYVRQLTRDTPRPIEITGSDSGK